MTHSKTWTPWTSIMWFLQGPLYTRTRWVLNFILKLCYSNVRYLCASISHCDTTKQVLTEKVFDLKFQLFWVQVFCSDSNTRAQRQRAVLEGGGKQKWGGGAITLKECILPSHHALVYLHRHFGTDL